MNLILTIIRLPWWVHIAFAGLLAYGGWSMNDRIAASDADLAQALAGVEPEAVPLDQLDAETHISPLDEGRVFAQIDTAYNIRLIERTNGIKSDETVMYVLFGPDKDADARLVEAVVMVEPEEVDRFAEWVLARMEGFGPRDITYDIHGEFDTYHSQSSHAREVLEERGLEPARPMYFVTPFLDGRAAGLEQAARGDGDVQMIAFGAAGLFALFGLAKLGLRRGTRRRGPSEAGVSGAAGMAVPSFHATGGIPAGKIDDAAFANPHQRPGQPIAPITETAAPQAGPKATRAARLLEKQRAQAAQAGETATRKPMSALEQARAFRKSVSGTAAPTSASPAQSFRDKMKEDPFAKLAQEGRS